VFRGLSGPGSVSSLGSYSSTFASYSGILLIVPENIRKRSTNLI
jgi:hypothetical protein